MNSLNRTGDTMKTNEAKHTVGPYSFSGIAGDNHIMARVGEVKQTVGIVTGWPGMDPEELEANKRLFASAPDLLRQRDELREALRAMCDRVDQQHHDGRNDWTEDDADVFNRARALLEKSPA